MIKKLFLIFFIAILSITPIAQASHRNPVKAVNNELEKTYKIITFINPSEAIHCHQITNNRYKCTWHGQAENVPSKIYGCSSPQGIATVIYYRYGPEVNIRFSGQYQFCNYPY